MRKRADMILVRVSQHDGFDRDVAAREPRHLGDISPQPERGLVGEHHAAIDHDRAPGAFDRHQVQADLAEPAEGYDSDRRGRGSACRHRPILPPHRAELYRSRIGCESQSRREKLSTARARGGLPCEGGGITFSYEVAKMAASVNKVILIGNLGRDPETRFTNSGSSVTSFSIATTESFADKSGTRQERTEWHNITVWGKQGEACAQYLKKGSSAYIEGRITYREYEAKDGSGKRKATDIVAMRVQFLSSRGGAPAGDDAGGFGGGARGRTPAGGGGGGTISLRWTTKTYLSRPIGCGQIFRRLRNAAHRRRHLIADCTNSPIDR